MAAVAVAKGAATIAKIVPKSAWKWLPRVLTLLIAGQIGKDVTKDFITTRHGMKMSDAQLALMKKKAGSQEDAGKMMVKFLLGEREKTRKMELVDRPNVERQNALFSAALGEATRPSEAPAMLANAFQNYSQSARTSFEAPPPPPMMSISQMLNF